MLNVVGGFRMASHAVIGPTRIGTIAPWTGALLTTLPPVYYPLEIVPIQYYVIAFLAPTVHSQLAKIALEVSTPI